ncbi:MAG: hypothetical protein M3Q81_00370 [bacterium]|nr:hypothetical protein [bacterium]
MPTKETDINQGNDKDIPDHLMTDADAALWIAARNFRLNPTEENKQVFLALLPPLEDEMLADESSAESYGITVEQLREVRRLVNETPQNQWPLDLYACFQADTPDSLEGVAELVVSWIKARDSK